MRPASLLLLLQSVREQTRYPDEILVVDGSTNQETERMLQAHSFQKLTYFAVPPEQRGLTKQRNYGVRKVNAAMEVVCFLDDDTVLEKDYFKELMHTFQNHPEVSGVGGVASNENKWEPLLAGRKYPNKRYYLWEGFAYKEGQRNVVRNYLGLQSNLGPGRMPDFSHGRTCGFPLTGKTYDVDLLIGMSFAFRKYVMDAIQFSSYFEGYGLYEDADFSLRALAFGKNVINTKARLSHLHHPSGRPNSFNYGKMVVRNGWYVWRVKNPHATVNAQVKWHSITLLLAFIRFSNTFTSVKAKEAFLESVGRLLGWWSLLFNPPKV